jgi:hypothetical protein
MWGCWLQVPRVKQLQSAMVELERKQQLHHALVIAGDFNCELGASACGAYLSFGSVRTPTVWRTLGQPISTNNAHLMQL